MRNIWARPLTVVQQFDANEAISACGDGGKVYNFQCTAGGGEYGGVWQETNGKPGLQITGVNADTKITSGYASYHACGDSHSAESNSTFIQNCYYLPESAWSGYPYPGVSTPDTSKAISVIVWRGPWGNDVHCTTNLDMSTWETAKS